MSHESAPTGPIDPSITEPGAAVPEPVVPDPERVAEATRLSSDQIGVLTKYVHNATDRRFDGDDYRGAVGAMQNREGNVALGEVAITAATIGAMSRDPATFARFARGLTERLGAGMQKEHVEVFSKMQRDYRGESRPIAIAETVRSGIKYLDRRQTDHGEDVSQARVAFLASGFAATQDLGLRQALIRQLRAG